MKKFGYGKLAWLCFAATVVSAIAESMFVERSGVRSFFFIAKLICLVATLLFWWSTSGTLTSAEYDKKLAERRNAEEMKRAAQEEKRQQAQQALAEYNSPENQAKREALQKKELQRKEDNRRPASMSQKSTDVGCLYFLIAFPLAILTLPFRLAADMMGGKKRRR